MKSKLMWIIYFIASFAAFHYGWEAFGFSLLSVKAIAAMPRLVQLVKVIFGICGLISLITLFTGCEECK